MTRCGNDPNTPISRQVAKTIANFDKFLRGKGSRCPLCLHKASRHSDGLMFTGAGAGCRAQDNTCRCDLSEHAVRNYHATK